MECLYAFISHKIQTAAAFMNNDEKVFFTNITNSFFMFLCY